MPADVRCELSPPAGSPYRVVLLDVRDLDLCDDRDGMPYLSLALIAPGHTDTRGGYATVEQLDRLWRDLKGFVGEMLLERDREAVAEMRRQLGEFDAEEGE